MTEIHIVVPRDALQALLEGRQRNFPFTQTGGPCSPLRVIIYAGEARPPRRFVPPPKEGR